MLDVYCERAGAGGLWAEPVNAISNLAFVVAAVAVGLRLVRTPAISWRVSWDLWLLALLLAAIGVGSGLWHTSATRWGLLADVVPITLFINLYLLAFGWRALALRGVRLLLLWLCYQTASIALLAVVPADALNGSMAYLPALAFLVGFAIWLYLVKQPPWRTVAVAAGLFGVSITFRTLDLALCASVPLGTHFLWHLFNAMVLFLLLDGLLRSVREATPRT